MPAKIDKCHICGKGVFMLSTSSWRYKVLKNSKKYIACSYECFNKLQGKVKINKHMRR